MAKREQGEGWAFVSEGMPDVVEDEISASRAPEDQRIRISLEKRKKGKVVTLLGNLVLTKGDMKDLAKALRGACGTGGTFHDTTIELQGDCRERAREWLVEDGWGVR
ncbi:MAG: translation initiation factor [bacterium]|nr:translation initiation factor [bacterium]